MFLSLLLAVLYSEFLLESASCASKQPEEKDDKRELVFNNTSFTPHIPIF
jgi:hypothetical protein